MMINVYNSQQGEVIYRELSNFIENEGYEIVRIRINKGRKIKKCQIMIEKINSRKVSIVDCEKVNKEVFLVFKNDTLGLKDFRRAVSSPGIDKPLTRVKDYIASKEKMVKVHTLYKVQDRRSFKGYIKDVDENSVKIKLVDIGEVITLGFNSISEAYLKYEF